MSQQYVIPDFLTILLCVNCFTLSDPQSLVLHRCSSQIKGTLMWVSVALYLGTFFSSISLSWKLHYHCYLIHQSLLLVPNTTEDLSLYSTSLCNIWESLFEKKLGNNVYFTSCVSLCERQIFQKYKYICCPLPENIFFI